MWNWINNSSGIWEFLLMVMTALLVAVAWRQLYSLRQESKVKFLNELRSQFFSDEFTLICFLLENNLLEYQSREISVNDGRGNRESYCFFIVKRNSIINEGLINIPENLRSVQKPNNNDSSTNLEIRPISCYEIDQWFLSPVEDLSSYEKRHFIDFD